MQNFIVENNGRCDYPQGSPENILEVKSAKMFLGNQEIKGIGSYSVSAGFVKTNYQINLVIDASQVETEKLIKDIDNFIYQRTKGQCAYDAMMDVAISSSTKEKTP